MLRDIAELDWKVLRRLHPVALERFCERTLAEIERSVQDRARGQHERYIDIFNLVQRRDQQMARLFDDLRRSRALAILAQIRAEGLLTDEEFSMFSQETRHTVEVLLGAR